MLLYFYIPQHVNPKNFLNILQGNKDAMKKIGSGRVIERYLKRLYIIKYLRIIF